MDLKEYWTEDRLSNLNKFVLKSKITRHESLWDFLKANNNDNTEYRINIVRHPRKNSVAKPRILGQMYVGDCKLCTFSKQGVYLKNIVPARCNEHKLCNILGGKLSILSNVTGDIDEGKPIYYHYTTVAELYKR